MSVEAITWALKQPVKPSSTKFVLVALANCSHTETGLAHPSVKYLTEATGQDRKTVLGNIQKLIAWGLIEDSGERVGATRQVIVYRLNVGPDLFMEQSQKRNSSENGTVPKTPDNSTVLPPKQSQKRDTEPLEPSGTVSKSKAPAAQLPSPPDWLEPEAWAGFVDMRKRTRHPLTPRAAELIFKELARLRSQSDPNRVLDQSTRNGWRDVFPLRQEDSRGTTRKPSTQERIESNVRAARDDDFAIEGQAVRLTR